MSERILKGSLSLLQHCGCSWAHHVVPFLCPNYIARSIGGRGVRGTIPPGASIIIRLLRVVTSTCICSLMIVIINGDIERLRLDLRNRCSSRLNSDV